MSPFDGSSSQSISLNPFDNPPIPSSPYTSTFLQPRGGRSSPATPIIDRSQTSSPLMGATNPVLPSSASSGQPDGSLGGAGRRRLPMPFPSGSISSLWSTGSSSRGAGGEDGKNGSAPPPAFDSIEEDAIAYVGGAGVADVHGKGDLFTNANGSDSSGPVGAMTYREAGSNAGKRRKGGLKGLLRLERNSSGIEHEIGGDPEMEHYLPMNGSGDAVIDDRSDGRGSSEGAPSAFRLRMTRLFHRSSRRRSDPSNRTSLDDQTSSPSPDGIEAGLDENGSLSTGFATNTQTYTVYPDDGLDHTVKPPSMTKLFKEDYKKTSKWFKTTSWRDHRRKACAAYLWKWYGIIFLFVAIGVLLGAKHNTVVRWLEPKVDKVKQLPAGWLVPIAILFIISFPPLVGHEVVGILCGVIYGLGVGFAILAAGTFLGELGEWFAFKACCTSRAAKFERKNQFYFALTQLIREKSFMFVLILRFSAVPGHLTTALSASAGANLFSYCMAAILTLPKQLTLVYLGVAFESTDKKSHYISVGTTLLTIVMTGVAAAYIYYQMRLLLIRQENRKARAEAALAESPLQMAGLPNSSSVISLEDKLRAAGYPPAYRSSPYDTIEEGGRRNGRRPHLRTESSVVGTRQAPSRARSLPGNAASEFEAYIAELRDDREPSNAGGVEADIKAPRSEHGNRPLRHAVGGESSGMARSGTVTPPRHLAPPSATFTRPRSGTNASVDSTASFAPLVPTADQGQSIRGTTSLDMWRPVHMTLGDAAQRMRMSGTEIAAEADQYAVAHGGKRPDMGRMRGESTAALLGRPNVAESRSS